MLQAADSCRLAALFEHLVLLGCCSARSNYGIHKDYNPGFQILNNHLTKKKKNWEEEKPSREALEGPWCSADYGHGHWGGWTCCTFPWLPAGADRLLPACKMPGTGEL